MLHLIKKCISVKNLYCYYTLTILPAMKILPYVRNLMAPKEKALKLISVVISAILVPHSHGIGLIPSLEAMQIVIIWIPSRGL